MPLKLLRCTRAEEVNMASTSDEAHIPSDQAQSADGSDGSDVLASDAPCVSELVQAFCVDLQETFPELEDAFVAVCALGKEELESYVKKEFPPAFFDILYKNDKAFAKSVEFLPGVDFRYLWNRNISDGTRESIWKHLQVLLFAVVSDVEDAASFGDAQAFFEAVDTTAFRAKLEEVLGAVGEGCDEGPQPEDVEEHLTGLLGGRIGRLAQQIAEDASADFEGLDSDAGVEDVFSALLGDPMKLMKLIKKIGTRIDADIKSGAMKESDLLQEATELLEKMRTTPGMEGMHDMMAKMGVSNERDIRVAQGQMGDRLKKAKTRDRLREKLAQRRAATAAAATASGSSTTTEEAYPVTAAACGPPESGGAATATSPAKKKKRKKKKPISCTTDHGN
jgi:hypothetical protein